MNIAAEEPAATMREVLASLPGFSLKSSRRRSTKRLSATAQLEAGLVDLESPASILASTSLRALLNRHTFQGLPPLYQRKLAQLLPAVDRQVFILLFFNNLECSLKDSKNKRKLKNFKYLSTKIVYVIF